MIILELITIFISIFLISISFAGYGSLINLKIENNYFIDIFLGFIIIAFLISTIHFFLKINFLISSVIFTLGIIIYFKKKKLIYLNLIEKKFFYLCVIFLLLPMLISQKYHEDFGYYHLPYAIALIEEK